MFCPEQCEKCAIVTSDTQLISNQVVKRTDSPGEHLHALLTAIVAAASL